MTKSFDNAKVLCLNVELEQLENLRQMFVAMTDDYRIILCRNQISGAPQRRCTRNCVCSMA